MKWMGVGIMSLVMGVFLAGIVHAVTPLTSNTFIVVAVLGTALLCTILARLAHAAGSIEVHHHGGAVD
jgi:ABC-type thiamin/hydroxymethylpyrimidine transport system permease subunit